MHKFYITILFILLAFISLLVILTKGQPALVRKKIMLGLLIMSLTAPAATVVSCKSGSSISQNVWMTEGWVDRDTYRIISFGAPGKGTTDPGEIKERARKNAVLNAHYTIIERFKGSRIESCGGIIDYDYLDSLIRELLPVIKNGKIIAERYDENLNCEIVYEIKAKNLRKTVRGYE